MAKILVSVLKTKTEMIEDYYDYSIAEIYLRTKKELILN